MLIEDKKLLSAVFILPINGFINNIITPISKIPNTGYNNIGFMPSKLLGKKLNIFLNKTTTYPAIKPASKAPKNPELTRFMLGSLKYANVTPNFAIIPPTKPTASPGLSAILIAI